MDVPIPPLSHARLGPSLHSFSKIANALPPGSSTETIYLAHVYTFVSQPHYAYVTPNGLSEMSDFIDQRGTGFTLADRVMHMMAPIPWRDDICLGVAAKYIQMYRKSLNVDLMACIQHTNFMEVLARVERPMAAKLPPKSTSSILQSLEAFHKSLVLYIWMSFRNPVAYSNYQEAGQLKTRLEKAMDWCLQGMSKNAKLHYQSSNIPILLRGRTAVHAAA